MKHWKGERINVVSPSETSLHELELGKRKVQLALPEQELLCKD